MRVHAEQQFRRKVFQHGRVVFGAARHVRVKGGLCVFLNY